MEDILDSGRWRPNPKEAGLLAQYLEELKLPTISESQVDEYMGEDPEVIGESPEWVTYLSKDVEITYPRSLEDFRIILGEGKLLQAREDRPGHQRLVGICPENLSLVATVAVPLPIRPTPRYEKNMRRLMRQKEADDFPASTCDKSEEEQDEVAAGLRQWLRGPLKRQHWEDSQAYGPSEEQDESDDESSGRKRRRVR